MDIAIGLPNAIPNTPGHRFVEWAAAAEAAGFSSLGTIGRMVFDCHEELIALAGAAAVTKRIGLTTSVLIAPSRDPVLLAKQAASLDTLSNGRFTLGVGIGWRDDEYRAAGCPELFSRRGKLLEEHIGVYRSVWGQKTLPGFDAAVGPRANPGLLIGSNVEAGIRRAGKIADGFFSAPADRETTSQRFSWVRQEWDRPGEPRLVAARYFALGEDVAQEADAAMSAYYEKAGPDFTKMMLGWVMRSRDQVMRAIDDMRAAGAQELFFWPATNRLSQVERLAEVALASV